MFFIYNKGILTLKRGSEDIHGLKVGGNYYTFYNDELNLLKTLIEENCNAENKDRILKNKNYKKVDDFYLDKNDKILALEGNGNDVFEMTNKGLINYVVNRFIEIIKDKKGDKMETRYIAEITILDNEIFVESSTMPISHISVIEILNGNAMGGTTFTRGELSKLIDSLKCNCEITHMLVKNHENLLLVDDLITKRTPKGLQVIGVYRDKEWLECKDIGKALKKILKTNKPHMVNTCSNPNPRFRNPGYLGNNPRVYSPNQPYMDPNYHHFTQQQYLNPNFQQLNQRLNDDALGPKYYYLNLGEAELVLEQGYPIRNYLEIKEVIIKDRIHETGKEAKARVADIFHRYIDELEKEEEEINALISYIKDLLPKNEKVELLLGTGDGLNAVIQYENNEGINTIKIKSYGTETIVYTKPAEPMVFKTNSYYFKEKIINKIQKLVEEHNRKIENGKEF